MRRCVRSIKAGTHILCFPTYSSAVQRSRNDRLCVAASFPKGCASLLPCLRLSARLNIAEYVSYRLRLFHFLPRSILETFHVASVCLAGVWPFLTLSALAELISTSWALDSWLSAEDIQIWIQEVSCLFLLSKVSYHLENVVEVLVRKEFEP